MYPSELRLRQFALLLAAAFAAFLVGCGRPDRPHRIVATVGQIRELADSELPVSAHLRGIVTFTDPKLNVVFLEDSSGGVRIEGADAFGIASGGWAEVTGVVRKAGTQPVILAQTVKAVAAGHLAPAVKVDFRNLDDPALQYRRIEVQGAIRYAGLDRSGTFTMLLNNGGKEARARIRESIGDLRTWLDREVDVRGVLSISADAQGHPGEPVLWVETIDDITPLKPAPEFARLPVWTARALRTARAADLPAHRVLVRNAAISAGGDTLRDSTGELPARLSQGDVATAGASADWTGFIAQQGGKRVLVECIPAQWLREARPLGVLKSVREVHSLPVDLAGRAYPVDFEAVVTYSDQNTRNLFVQDATDGIYANMWAVSTTLPPAGERVHVTGFSGPGDIAPVIAHPQLQPLGPGKMPPPFTGDMEQLLAGEPESQWVEARGVVRSVGAQDDHALLIIGWGNHRFRAHVSGVERLPDSLVGSRIRLHGVCGARFNSKRQLLGVQIFVPGPEYLVKEGDAPGEPPLEKIDTLLKISGEPAGERRSRFRGVVTLSHKTGPTWVEDATGGVLIQNHPSIDLQTGDVVEVTGFAEPGAFSPVMRDAAITRVGRNGATAPPLLTPTDILQEGYDSELIRVDGYVVDKVGAGEAEAVILRSGDAVFEARMDSGVLPSVESGALVRLTGVSSIAVDDSRDLVVPKSFSLLLRNPADVIILDSGPWLNFDRMLKVTGLVLAVALLAFAWIAVLRRRVRQQTADLRKARDAAEAANKAKSQFLATMSHEIRTPMNGVLGMTELVLAGDLSSQQREDLETARDSGLSLLSLLNDILDLSKIEAGKVELEAVLVDVGACVADAVRVLQVRAREKNIDLVSHVGVTVPPFVVSDYVRIRQVLLNLIGNAIKFTEKGSVEVSVALAQPESEGHVVLRFSVSDTGIGIPGDKQKLVFEAFRQADSSTARKYGGSGLGLAICSRLVKLMGGDICLSSEADKGATFSFTIRVPVAALGPLAPSAAGDVAPSERQAARSLDVLVADDNAVNQRLIRRVLEKAGHHVALVNNGVEAVARARLDKFDVILMDVEMPEMDGFEATSLIRSAEDGTRRVPIVAMTAHAMSGDRERCLHAGMDHYLSKPISTRDLEAVLSRFASAQRPVAPR